jgi:hypothetical protein
MHCGLYVEMGQFLCVSLSGWAQRDGAVNAPGLSAAIPLLVVIKLVSSDGLMVANIDRLLIPDPFGTDLGGQNDVRTSG